jgi:hypothetical protein
MAQSKGYLVYHPDIRRHKIRLRLMVGEQPVTVFAERLVGSCVRPGDRIGFIGRQVHEGRCIVVQAEVAVALGSPVPRHLAAQDRMELETSAFVH